MKLRLEFDDDDFNEMITGYFVDRGFNVHNIKHVTDQFKTTYPEGLIIEASPLNGHTPAKPDTPDEIKEDEVVEPTETEEKEEDKSGILSYNEIKDPTHHVEGNEGIFEILKTSKKIETDRNAENED